MHHLVPSWHQDYADSPDEVVTAVRRMPAAEAAVRADARGRRPAAGAGARRRGASAQLFTHQAAAAAFAMRGESVVVTTPTASGKTLCYNVPVLNAILADPSTRALYLFPTKALAQDQLAELDRLAQVINESAGLDLGVFTYDGDTPQDARRAIRARAQVILTNPDMLHSGILPHHPKWARLFENLRFIVIDELHAYRGVFGSHLANVLRRLRRVCRHYGSDPVFICSSATIANPRELAERLTERPFELVDESGAPRGEKFFFFVNPPIVNKQLGIRRSYTQETRRVALEFLRRGLQIIVFAQSRLVTEILTRYLKDTRLGAARARTTWCAATGAATCRTGGARSRRGCATARCGPSWRRARSSWGSTSARSTWRCSPATRGRSPPRGSGRGARAAGRGSRPRCWWPAARRSISTSSATRRTSSTPRPSTR